MKKNWIYIAILNIVFILVVAGCVYYYFGPSYGGNREVPIALGKSTNRLKSTNPENSFNKQNKPAANTLVTPSVLNPATSSPVISPNVTYPVHQNITATVFWVGEPIGGGSSEDNAVSAWDDEWQKNYGGFDDPQSRNGFLPVGFTPLENPFYLDLPYNDFEDNGFRKTNAAQVVYWAKSKTWGKLESMMKNRWVKLTRNGVTCYGQIEDAGPYQYDDYVYVFGTSTPKSKLANNAGLDVSPALRDCLKFNGWNNDENKVDWQFVEAKDVPAGPWKIIVTTSQINWP
jgi:hypothetical protein